MILTSLALAAPTAEVCPSLTPVSGFVYEVGYAPGRPAEGARAALADAYRNVVAHRAGGFSEVRTAALLRNTFPWQDPVYTPGGGGLTCVTVAIDVRWMDSLEEDATALERDLADLARTVSERVGDAVLSVPAPTWASGCVTDVGAAVRAQLLAALGTAGVPRLLRDGAAPADRSLVLELAATSTALTVTPSLLHGREAEPLPGFAVPLDLFGTSPGDAGRCRSDDALGLDGGARVGVGGLTVAIRAGGTAVADGEACEGESIDPVVVTSGPARLRVYTVDERGLGYLVWPPPGQPDRVDGPVPLGRATLVPVPEGGDERLVAVAVPVDGGFGSAETWSGFCRLPEPVSSENLPAAAALGTATWIVRPAGAPGCPGAPSSAAQAAVAAPTCR